ncbi:MAG: VWA domain-containing protein, partial [Myxococcales bacterium]|nr:VWA domain-containing protein [Myxococcales bacterium]
MNHDECERCISHGITALTNQKAAILSAIADLDNPTGTTNITQGLGWGWRVVKPAAPFTEAVANPEYKRQQAIVLLTDGENVPGNGDGYKATFGMSGYAQSKMDQRLRTLAANIKADGVIIYVIQFANDGTDLQLLLKEIASGPDTPYYYYAPD